MLFLLRKPERTISMSLKLEKPNMSPVQAKERISAQSYQIGARLFAFK
jgi:hypothetical protein